MAAPATQTQTLIAVLWPVGDKATFRNIVLVILGLVLLGISAHIQVPFQQVPITLQSLVVLLLSAFYGWLLASVTILAYLALGAMGLPVFASGTGITYMMGPTGGYLLGFLIAGVVIGFMAERGFDRKIATSITMFCLGELFIFAFGVGYLSTLFGWQKAILVGLVPLIPGETIKLGLAVALTAFIWRKVES